MKLELKNLGQIKTANVDFGDLTLLVGPQASGKSIFLQTFKLMQDHASVAKVIKKYGFTWKKNFETFSELYYGEGMRTLISGQTSLKENGLNISSEELMNGKSKKKEQVFYIPAQRVMSLDNGWPKPYTTFAQSDPFVLKKFSEHLRMLMEAGLGVGEKNSIFPQEGRLKRSLRTILDKSIFNSAKIELDDSQVRKRIVLKIGDQTLPFMSWSAGQKEFLPLLLGLYWLIPSAAARKKRDINWVIIEEPEMGLHPYAIKSLMLLFLELTNRNYKVIISTHSSVALEVLWVIQTLKNQDNAVDAILDLFDISHTDNQMKILIGSLIKKDFKVYYFEKDKSEVNVKDISNLDPFNDDSAVSDWGGISEFSSHASSVVSKYINTEKL